MVLTLNQYQAVLRIWIRIRIRRVRMFLGLLDSYCFVTSFYFLSLKNDANVPTKSNKQKNL
jgi:hypothetical protein